MRISLLAVGAIVLASLSDAGADDYADAWAPPVGSELPPIQALDQHGAERDLASLSGANGLLLVAVRSADW